MKSNEGYILSWSRSVIPSFFFADFPLERKSEIWADIYQFLNRLLFQTENSDTHLIVLQTEVSLEISHHSCKEFFRRLQQEITRKEVGKPTR